jgi:hypothetical protein
VKRRLRTTPLSHERATVPTGALVTLSRLGLVLGVLAPVCLKRAADVVRLVEAAFVVAADVSLVGAGVDQLTLVRLPGRFHLTGLRNLPPLLALLRNPLRSTSSYGTRWLAAAGSAPVGSAPTLGLTVCTSPG